MEEDDKGCTMIRMGVSGWMFLLVLAYPGSPGQKAVKRLCVCVIDNVLTQQINSTLSDSVLVSCMATALVRDFQWQRRTSQRDANHEPKALYIQPSLCMGRNCSLITLVMCQHQHTTIVPFHCLSLPVLRCRPFSGTNRPTTVYIFTILITTDIYKLW